MKNPRKPTRLEKGILIAVVWLAKDVDRPNTAADLAVAYGVSRLDVSGLGGFDREVLEGLNGYPGVEFAGGLPVWRSAKSEIAKEIE